MSGDAQRAADHPPTGAPLLARYRTVRLRHPGKYQGARSGFRRTRPHFSESPGAAQPLDQKARARTEEGDTCSLDSKALRTWARARAPLLASQVGERSFRRRLADMPTPPGALHVCESAHRVRGSAHRRRGAHAERIQVRLMGIGQRRRAAEAATVRAESARQRHDRGPSANEAPPHQDSGAEPTGRGRTHGRARGGPHGQPPRGALSISCASMFLLSPPNAHGNPGPRRQ